jgi:hypothetical protein
VNALLVVNKDPGFNKNTEVPFVQMMEVFDATMLCADCETIRTSRSRHCYVCKRCVERYDHHCPWINNCVGFNNHNCFFLYVTSISVLLLISLTESFYTLSQMINMGYA